MNIPLPRPTSKTITLVEALRAIDPPEPATLLPKCPWCGEAMNGSVFVCFKERKVTAVSQTKRIGRHDYTWTHTKEKCRVPNLDRISPTQGLTKKAAVR